jgi:hypothetical protein
MRTLARVLRRAALPLAAFLGVFLVHFTWLILFPEQDPAQSRWATVAEPVSPLIRYIESQDYWLGYSYGLALSFTVLALRRYREGRFCTARNMTIGGITFTGFLAVAGCFLVGCCGSPMLVVYLNLFGAAFLPLAKPLMAMVTTTSIGLSWWWMHRSERTSSRLVPLDALAKSE